MEFLKNLDLNPMKIAKVLGLGFLGVIAAVFIFSLVSSTLKPILGGGGYQVTMPGIGGGMGGVAYPDRAAPEPAIWYGETDMDMGMGMSYGKGAPSLSVRNIYPVPPSSGSVGSDAEEYEARDYNISIETQERDEACAAVAGLKSLDYVVFENANESDTACNYTFKVEHARVDEILGVLKGLDPKDLSENIRTIKNEIEDFTSQTDILKKKLASIDATLSGALDAYDDLVALAPKTQDVATLVRIVDSKLQTIERLTNERLAANSQLEALARAKAAQVDHLDYSRFYVSIYENRFVDPEALRDSWKAAIKEFVWNVNRAIQDASVNLIALVLSLVPYVLYLLILLFAAKYGWRLAKKLWKS